MQKPTMQEPTIQESTIQEPGASKRERLKLFAAFLIVGVVSLVQPGCNCSSNDSAPPPSSAVSSVSPVENSTTALVSTKVSAIFLNEMDSATVENGFSLMLNNTPVTATVVYDVATKTATLTPTNNLDSGAEYFASIDSSVKDSNGNFPLPSGFIWSFNTSSSMQLVSKNSSAVTANDSSLLADIDGTGRFIVFESEATNLVTLSTTLNRSNIYRKDTVTGEVVLVSTDETGLVEANNNCANPSISANGRFVVFESNATNLDAAIVTSPNGPSQIFLKDLEDDSIELVSRSVSLVPDNSTNGSINPGVSDDGRYIVFESADNALSQIDGNTFIQVYRKDMNDEAVEMISRSVGDLAGNGASTNPDMSANGAHIVFESEATNFGASSGGNRIYYVDTSIAHAVEKISVTTAGLDAISDASSPSVSDDGSLVVFHTDATNLDPLDTNGLTDVYFRNRASVTPTTTLVSLNQVGTSAGNSSSSNARISGNSNYIVFESLAADLVADDTNGVKDIFVRNLSALVTDRVNNPSSGSESSFPISAAFQHQPVISADGRYVGFHSEEQYSIDDTDTLSDVFRAYNNSYQ
jgi:hypothetical protein